MTGFDPAQGAQSVYNFWLGLVPQFLAQVGSPQSWKTMTQAAAPGGDGGFPNFFAPWSHALTSFGSGTGDETATAASAAQAMFAPWMSFMSSAAAAMPFAGGFAGSTASAPGGPSVLPLQAMNQAWIDVASRFVGATPAQLTAAFDRAYGALSDALGFGPARELQAAWQDMVAASVAQQEARTNYAVLLQGAFAEGLQRVMARLAEKADAGERIDSVLALIRLWAVCTEEVVHQTLQSEAGLAATAALARSALAYRKRLRRVVAIVADMLDLATRHDLDLAYREIQTLKRELRTLKDGRVREKRKGRRSSKESGT